MTTYSGIECPCYGTLSEIHRALIDDLEWLGSQVSLNGWGFTVTEKGFRSNESNKDYDSKLLAEFLHNGTAILIRKVETGFEHNYEGDLPDHFEIATTGKIPHVSKRCAICGIQLNQDDQKRGACTSCYGQEVAGDDREISDIIIGS